jgi:mannose-6-phosphate isomerase
MTLNLSGNIITEFGAGTQARQDFDAAGPYRMWRQNMQAGEKFTLQPAMTAYTVFVVSGAITANTTILNAYDCINAINQHFDFTCTETASVIVSGIVDAVDAPPQFTHVRADQQYRVEKPWGHELWISGKDNQYYSLKEVFIRAGNRTSLQYHNFKHETNVIFDGTATLFYQANMARPIDDLVADDLGTHDITGLSAINITPRVIHRLYAKTDVMIYETSTPHLDDVVRVSDDSGRSHGRVDAEHRAAS